MKIVDLTVGITPNIKIFSGYPQPMFIKWSKLEIHGYDSEVIFLSTHTGTHIDAPSHFRVGLRTATTTIDEVALNRFICRALLLKVSKRANQTITYKDIINNCNKISEKDTIVFSTGWERHIKKDNYITENPGLSVNAAKFLVEKKVNAVAIDGPSIDAGTDSSFTVHKILLANNVIIIENLCNLRKIHNRRFTLLVAPLKLIGASGSPARAIGIEEILQGK